MLTPLQNLLIALIRVTISAADSMPDLHSLSSAKWRALYRLAAEQGVVGLLYPIVKSAFVKGNVPKEIVYGWSLSAEHIDQNYQNITQATEHLLSLYASEEIPLLLLKGSMLARYYPRPSLREFGDVDIFLSDGYERGNQVAVANGAVMKHDHQTAKHVAFTFEGVMFENHRTLLDLRGRTSRRLEQILIGELQGTKSQAGGLIVPSSLFNILFVLRHTATHFAWGVPLRNLCDWGFMLYNEGAKTDLAQLREQLIRAGMLKTYNAFTRAAEYVTGLSLEAYLLGDKGGDQADRIVEDCFYTHDRANHPHSMLQKLHRMWQTRWKYRALLPDSYLRAWLHAITYRLRH